MIASRILSVVLTLGLASTAGAIGHHSHVAITATKGGATVDVVYSPEHYSHARTVVVPQGTPRQMGGRYPKNVLHDFGLVTFKVQPNGTYHDLKQETFHLPYDKVKKGQSVHLMTVFYTQSTVTTKPPPRNDLIAHAFGAKDDATYLLP